MCSVVMDAVTSSGLIWVRERLGSLTLDETSELYGLEIATQQSSLVGCASQAPVVKLTEMYIFIS